MASRFLVPDRDQSFFRATSYRELLGPDDLVWTVIEVVEGLDLSAVYSRYGPDPSVGGRPAFDPAMMLCLLVFGYCEGKRSARELEVACRRDVAYQAICGGLTPDHATIARFRAGLDDLIEGLFIAVLVACEQRGLVEVGRVALDGTRMRAAASKEATVGASRLAVLEAEVRQVLSETQPDIDTVGDSHSDTDTDLATDSDSDADADGGGRGWSESRRRADTEQRLERISRAQAEALRVAESRAADQQRRGRIRGGGQEPSGNLTDPDSRLQKTRNGFIQGYNGQVMVSADQIVIAAQLISDGTDVAMLGPMIETARHNLTSIGADKIGTVLADAGYWSHANASLEDHYTVQGEPVRLLIAPSKTFQVGEIDPIKDNASEPARSRHRMQTRLAIPENQTEYRQRSWMVEGTFAHQKTHRNISQFSRRGLTACDAEWKLIHLAGNILKIHRHAPTTPPHTPPTPPSPPTAPLSCAPTATTASTHQPQRHHPQPHRPNRHQPRRPRHHR